MGDFALGLSEGEGRRIPRVSGSSVSRFEGKGLKMPKLGKVYGSHLPAANDSAISKLQGGRPQVREIPKSLPEPANDAQFSTSRKLLSPKNIQRLRVAAVVAGNIALRLCSWILLPLSIASSTRQGGATDHKFKKGGNRREGHAATTDGNVTEMVDGIIKTRKEKDPPSLGLSTTQAPGSSVSIDDVNVSGSSCEGSLEEDKRRLSLDFQYITNRLPPRMRNMFHIGTTPLYNPYSEEMIISLTHRSTLAKITIGISREPNKPLYLHCNYTVRAYIPQTSSSYDPSYITYHDEKGIKITNKTEIPDILKKIFKDYPASFPF